MDKKIEKKHSEPKDDSDSLDKLRLERDEYLNGWKRSKADLINFKKETAESLGRFEDLAKVETLRELLPVYDALCEAEKHSIEGTGPLKNLFEQILGREGVKILRPKSGEPFDPLYHEAVSGKGELIDEVRLVGLMYKAHNIRPAKVTVKEKTNHE